MSTLQFPPPPESIELVTQNLLTEQLETLLSNQSYIDGKVICTFWQADILC